MRYITPTPSNTDGSLRFDLSVRPPDAEIPAELLDLLRERDAIGVARSAAETVLQDLLDDRLDLAAQAEDDAAAVSAARAGQAIPDAEAWPKLMADRTAAVRGHAIQGAAYEAVSNDAANLSARLKGELDGDAAKTKEQARARVAKAADKLATEVESAVSAAASHDWLNGSRYEPRARVQMYDILPKASQVQDLGPHLTGANFSARELIVNTATTVLEG